MNITALWAKPPQTDQERYFANRVCDFLQKAWDLTGMDIRQIEILNICDLSIILAPKPFFDHMANHEKWARPEYWKMIKGAMPIFHAAMGRYFYLMEELDRQVSAGKVLETTTDFQAAKDASFVMLGFYIPDEGINSIVEANRSGETWGKGWAEVMLREYGIWPIRMMQDELGLSSPQKRWEEKKRIYRQQQEQQNAS